ncbi:MAG: DinB family protein [Sediminibacterium sp.]|nr:DinB family protein [Sediminibacterium sp.]
MKRSELTLPDYFDRYILKTDDITLHEALLISLDELKTVPLDTWKQLGHAVYAPGKWTIHALLQHIIDTERVFTYRALAFARGEKDLKSFDEDQYAELAQADRRTLDELLTEAIALRQASILLFKSFSADMLNQTGLGFKGPYSVASIGFILAGHQRWHFEVIEQRYLPLLSH